MGNVFNLDEVESGASAPGFTFKVSGREWHCRSQSEMHWDTIRSWLLAQNGVGTEEGTKEFAGYITVHVDDFFKAVLMPDEIEDFLALKADPAGPFTASKVMALVVEINKSLLGQKQAANPTKRPVSSRAGSRTTKSTSRAGSRSPGTKASAG